MMRYKSKHKPISKIFSPQKLLVLVLLILIILISVPLAKSLSKRYEASQEIKDLQNQIASMEDKNKDLDNLISYLKSDQFVEEQARVDLNLKKAGENVIVIKGDSSMASTVAQAEKQSTISNPQRWLNYFFKK